MTDDASPRGELVVTFLAPAISDEDRRDFEVNARLCHGVLARLAEECGPPLRTQIIVADHFEQTVRAHMRRDPGQEAEPYFVADRPGGGRVGAKTLPQDDRYDDAVIVFDGALWLTTSLVSRGYAPSSRQGHPGGAAPHVAERVEGVRRSHCCRGRERDPRDLATSGSHVRRERARALPHQRRRPAGRVVTAVPGERKWTRGMPTGAQAVAHDMEISVTHVARKASLTAVELEPYDRRRPGSVPIDQAERWVDGVSSFDQ